MFLFTKVTHIYQLKHFDLQQNLPPCETIISQNRHDHLNCVYSVHDSSMLQIGNWKRKNIKRVLDYYSIKASEYSAGPSE